MTKIETAKMILKNSDGIAQTGDFVAAGISKSDLEMLCNAGIITRIRYGFYQCTDDCDTSEVQYISKLLSVLNRLCLITVIRILYRESVRLLFPAAFLKEK